MRVKPKTVENFVEDLKQLYDRFITVRAPFPYLRPSHIGQLQMESAPWYRKRGKHLILSFDRRLELDDIEHINDASYWVNQSFIVWLWSTLQQYNLVGTGKDVDLDDSLPGYKHVEITRRLRNVFSHTNGRYNPKRKEEKELFDKLVHTYGLKKVDPRRYNLQINEVLEPIYLGVLEYGKAKFKSNKAVGTTKLDAIEAMILREGLRIADVQPYKDLDLLAIVLNSGDVLQARISDFERLKKATAPQLKNWRLIGGGIGIHWEAVDEDLSLRGFIRESSQQEALRRLAGHRTRTKAKGTKVDARAK